MKGIYFENGSLVYILLVIIISCKFDLATPILSVDYLGLPNRTSVEQSSCYKQMLNPVTISWLVSGRPSILLSEYSSSLLTFSERFKPVSRGVLGVPPCFHQPTHHPYSERSTAKEADNAGRTSNEWNLWLTLLIAMVAAAILS